MAGDDRTAMLREAASARGFKLVKSRRRKAGGDFGKYGLTDSKGRECFGFGANGLTGDADAVLAYLRGGETASWKRSLMGVVGDGGTKAQSATPAKPQRDRDSASRSAGPARKPEARPKQAKATRKPRPPSAETKGQSKDEAEPAENEAAQSEADTAPLTIRPATAKDAKALAALLDSAPATLKRHLAALAKAGSAPLVAERDGLVGVIAWAIVPHLDRPPLARVTILVVAEAVRREGIGAALLAAAGKELKKAKVAELELLLDIALDAPAGFLRKTGWTRSANAYRRGSG